MLSGGGSQQTTAPAREGVPSDATGTFVIAHEVGHHVQNLIGLLPKVQRAQAQADEQTGNAISAHRTYGRLSRCTKCEMRLRKFQLFRDQII